MFASLIAFSDAILVYWAGALVGGASASAYSPIANNISIFSSLISSNGDVVSSERYINTIDINTLINGLSSTCITQNIT